MGADDMSTAFAGGDTFLPPPPTPAVPLTQHCNSLLQNASQLLQEAKTSWGSDCPGQPEARYIRTSFEAPLQPHTPEGGLSMDSEWQPDVVCYQNVPTRS